MVGQREFPTGEAQVQSGTGHLGPENSMEWWVWYDSRIS